MSCLVDDGIIVERFFDDYYDIPFFSHPFVNFLHCAYWCSLFCGEGIELDISETGWYVWRHNILF